MINSAKPSEAVQAGNKGACAVSWSFGEATGRPTRFLAICCHLEAHTHKVERRNRNARHILSALHLQPPPGPRGLSQTRFSSFFPSYSSPLRGRSRSRAASPAPSVDATTPPLPHGTGHARGRSLPPHAGAWVAAEVEETLRERGGPEARVGRAGHLCEARPHASPTRDRDDDSYNQGWLRGAPAQLLPAVSSKELTPVSEGAEQRGPSASECSDSEPSEVDDARAPTFRGGTALLSPAPLLPQTSARQALPKAGQLETAPSFVFGGPGSNREASTPRLTKCDGGTPRRGHRPLERARCDGVRAPLTSLAWDTATAPLPTNTKGAPKRHVQGDSRGRRHGAQAVGEGRERKGGADSSKAPLRLAQRSPVSRMSFSAGTTPSRNSGDVDGRDMHACRIASTLPPAPASDHFLSPAHATAVARQQGPGPLGEGEEVALAAKDGPMHVGLQPGAAWPGAMDESTYGDSLQRAGSMHANPAPGSPTACDSLQRAGSKDAQRAYIACLTQQAARRASSSAPAPEETRCASPPACRRGPPRHLEDLPLVGAPQRGRPPLIINSVTPECWQAAMHSAPLPTRPPFPVVDASTAQAPRRAVLPPPQPHLRGAPPLVISSASMEAALAADTEAVSAPVQRHRQLPPTVMVSTAAKDGQDIMPVRQDSGSAAFRAAAVECVDGPVSMCCSWPVRSFVPHCSLAYD